MLLHRHRKVGPAFDGRIVGDDHHLPARNPADARDHPGTRRLALVQPVPGKRSDLEEGGARIEQPVHARARQQLAARLVAEPVWLRAAKAG